MADMTLVVPPGALGFPISYGTQAYQPYREDHTNPSGRWLIDMPPDVARHFIGVGGFIVADRIAPSAARAKISIIRMFHPKGGSADDYPVDQDGFLLVPNGPDVAAMRSHGFKIEGEEPAPAPPPQMVPLEDHQRAVDHINALGETIRERDRDAKMARDQLDANQGEITELREKLAAAEKALAEATKPPPAA
jgi:hypothetical protein